MASRIHFVFRSILKHPYITLGLISVPAAAWQLRRFVAGDVCRSKARLDGKTVVITGGNTGIGLETAVDLAKRNARVILGCRTVERGERAAVEVRKRSGNDNVVFVQLDLASLDSVRIFATKILEDEPRVDILINNAGLSQFDNGKTVDGFEIHMGINHLGHFLLTNLLLDNMKRAPSARVVNVASVAYERVKEFDDEVLNGTKVVPSKGFVNQAYAHSKLANVLFTVALSKRLRGTTVTTNALHPGVVYTSMVGPYCDYFPFFLRPLLHFTSWAFLKTPRQGAQTTIHCAVAEELEGVTGKYFSDCKEKKVTGAVTEESADRLWSHSCKMVGLESNN